MKTYNLLARTAARCMTLAPLIGTAATVYALCRTFQRLDTSVATLLTGVEGILSGLAATVVLVLVSIPLAVLYDLVRWGGDDKGTA